MAVAIMGGLVVATALTVLFLPALYAAWFRVTASARAPAPKRAAAAATPAQRTVPHMMEGTA
jgi:multidrug efflux pump